MSELVRRETTDAIIRAAIAVHQALGPGLLVDAYEECLAFELASRGIDFKRQVRLPVVCREVRMDCACRLDVVVQDRVIVELKSMDALAPIHQAQLMTYLRLSGLRVGLLIHFNVTRLMDGLIRRVL